MLTSSRILEVLDKGKAAAVTSIVETVDQSTGKVIFENQSTVFIRGSGGFGGKKKGSGEFASSRHAVSALFNDARLTFNKCRSRTCDCSQHST